MTTPVRLSPSGADRWVNCPGSAVLEALHPLPPSPMAKEGEIAHKLAEDWFRHQFDPMSRIGEMLAQGPVTEDHARGAAAFVRAVRERWDGSSIWMPEYKAEIPALGCRGRIDLLLNQADGLWIWDYKHGRTFVSAVENWQLLAYAMAVADKAINPDRIHLCICQPNSFDPEGPVKIWTINRAQFQAYSARLVSAVAAARGPAPSTTPGPHCLWCSARGGCSALGRAVSAIFDYVAGADYSPDTPAALGVELDLLGQAAELVKARLSGLEADAVARFRRGERVPGWDTAPNMSHIKWTVPPADAATLADLAGVDIRKNEVLTPRQAMDAGVPAAIVEAVSGREKYGDKLKKSKIPEVF